MSLDTPPRNPQSARFIIMALLVLLGGVVGYRLGRGQGLAVISQQALSQSKLINTQMPSDKATSVNFQQFWEVWSILEEKYLDQEKLDKQKMVHGAIMGMTSSLGDPYTMFLPPVEQKRSQEDLQGSFYGVGIQLGYINNILAVTAPLKGSPAEKAGVKAGDLILHVKDPLKNLDKDTSGWGLDEAVNNIRGERGTKVTLLMQRTENQQAQGTPFEVELERGEIVVPSAEVQFIEKDGKTAAHITLSRFGDRTNQELNDIILQIEARSPKVSGIVLDLRNNPGGYLDGAITVASEFISSGTIVTQQGRVSKMDYPSNGKGRLAKYPVDVIVNKGSASASEIVAGALRDRRQSKLIGEKTFGKGTVQDSLQLEGGAGLHVTVARWLLPKGEWIHETGMTVDAEVTDDVNTPEDEVLNRAVWELAQ